MGFSKVPTPEDDYSPFNHGWRFVVVLCAAVILSGTLITELAILLLAIDWWFSLWK